MESANKSLFVKKKKRVHKAMIIPGYISEWLLANYKEKSKIVIEKKQIYERYKKYCKINNTNPLPHSVFGKCIVKLFPNIDRTKKRGTWCYIGLERIISPEKDLVKLLRTLQNEKHTTDSLPWNFWD